MYRGKKIKKVCINCKNIFEAFVFRVNQGGGKFCSIKCYKNYRRKHAKDEKYLDRIHQKKHKYGLTEKEYFKLFKDQNNCCAICGVSLDKVKACVDHCHKTKIVRGILCDGCNRGLGAFKDNVNALKKAIGYLRKTAR